MPELPEVSNQRQLTSLPDESWEWSVLKEKIKTTQIHIRNQCTKRSFVAIESCNAHPGGLRVTLILNLFFNSGGSCINRQLLSAEKSTLNIEDITILQRFWCSNRKAICSCLTARYVGASVLYFLFRKYSCWRHRIVWTKHLLQFFICLMFAYNRPHLLVFLL